MKLITKLGTEQCGVYLADVETAPLETHLCYEPTVAVVRAPRHDGASICALHLTWARTQSFWAREGCVALLTFDVVEA